MSWHSWSGEGAVPAPLSHLSLEPTAFEQAKANSFTSCKQQCVSYELQWSVDWGGKADSCLRNRLLTSLHKDIGEKGVWGDISLGYNSLAWTCYLYDSRWERWPCTGTRSLLVVIDRHPLLPHSPYPCIHPPHSISPPACPRSEFSCRLAVCMQTRHV